MAMASSWFCTNSNRIKFLWRARRRGVRVVGVEGEGVELSPVQRSTEAAREERKIESKI